MIDGLEVLFSNRSITFFWDGLGLSQRSVAKGEAEKGWKEGWQTTRMNYEVQFLLHIIFEQLRCVRTQKPKNACQLFRFFFPSLRNVDPNKTVGSIRKLPSRTQHIYLSLSLTLVSWMHKATKQIHLCQVPLMTKASANKRR